VAARDETLISVVTVGHNEFAHWIGIKKHNITEVREAELAADIDRRGQQLFAELLATPSRSFPERGFVPLHAELERVVQINRDAMFRGRPPLGADERSSNL
jgi:hypothetical protein